MTRSNTSTTLVLAALLGTGCGVYGLKTNATEQPTEPGARALAPEFALADTDGTLVSLDDLLAGGQPAVLVFYRGHW